MVGAATAPGLDGSALALATNSIVAVIQYRLGAVSFFDCINLMNSSSLLPLSLASLLPTIRPILV
jgi:carboxylesterase type B